VANKEDLQQKETNGISISAKEGSNIDKLRANLVEQVVGNFDMANETIVTNARHVEALEKTGESLDKALNGLETGITADFVAMDIRLGLHHLGTITGNISTDDLLGNIFSKFCIGK
jgi:tRNA modification GTPase